MTPRFIIGTSRFGCREWRAKFYPKDVLRHAAGGDAAGLGGAHAARLLAQLQGAQRDHALEEAKAALCVNDADVEGCPLVATASWGAAKLRRVDYTRRQVTAWAKKLSAQPWSEAYVFFRHEERATGPVLAAQMSSTMSKLDLGSRQSGQTQSPGTSSQRVPGAM